MAKCALRAARQAAGGKPVLVAGSSLGCVAALYLAAHCDVDGVLLQNPPALREVILARAKRMGLQWGARAIVRGVPAELDSIRNASRATAPAVFLIALADTIVPTETQLLVAAAYGGPKRVLQLPDVDHDTPLTVNELKQVEQLVTDLRAGLAR